MTYNHVLEAYNTTDCIATEMFYLAKDIADEMKKANMYRAQHLRQVQIKHQSGPNWGQQALLDSLARKTAASLQKIHDMETRMSELHGKLGL